jgi:hypothetical protein
LSETEEMEEWAPSFICSLKCDKCVERVVESAFEAESLVLDEEQMVESETEAKSFLLGSHYVDLNSETGTSLFKLLLQFKSIT